VSSPSLKPGCVTNESCSETTTIAARVIANRVGEENRAWKTWHGRVQGGCEYIADLIIPQGDGSLQMGDSCLGVVADAPFVNLMNRFQ
jgi:hypothetical protein